MSSDPEDWIDPDFKRGYEAARRHGSIEPQAWMSEQFLRGMRAAGLPVRKPAAHLETFPSALKRRSGTA